MEQVSRDQDPSGVWLGRWSRRLAVGHLRLQLPQPTVGASEDLRGVAFVSAILGDGAARDGPFEVVQEPGERSSRLQGFKQRIPEIGRASCRERV